MKHSQRRGYETGRGALHVVIPAFNEQERIAGVILGVAEYADRVLVINDSSTDSTSEAARDAGAIVIDLPQNMGRAMPPVADATMPWSRVRLSS